MTIIANDKECHYCGAQKNTIATLIQDKDGDEVSLPFLCFDCWKKIKTMLIVNEIGEATYTLVMTAFDRIPSELNSKNIKEVMEGFL